MALRAAMSTAEHFLQCALTFRDAERRTAPLPPTFASAADGVAAMMHTLLHEAAEAMATPLAVPPADGYLHPVDIDTDEPGIYDKRDDATHVLRRKPPFARVVYRARPDAPPSSSSTPPLSPPSPPLPPVAAQEAVAAAQAEVAKALRKAEQSAAAAEKRAEKARTETPEARAERLAVAREKREKRKAEQQQQQGEAAPPRPAPKPKAPPPPPPSEEALACAAGVVAEVLRPPRPAKRPRGGKVKVFEHPLPHHRHLEALQRCAPHAALLPALLHGTPCENLEVIQGPPGTGKTRSLVERLRSVPADARVFLCAPTNVGAANLYARCVAAGFGDECSLVVAPERVPLGTAVLSTDPARRLVVATVSGRGGPALDAQRFAAVFADEAAQTMEAWTWTLLRPEVELLVLAGDVRQLPAQVSETGRALKHERSLMERLVVDLQYDNVVTLTVQHRMAPQLLAFPNAEFYASALTTGAAAPTEGTVEVRWVAGGAEEAAGTSFLNRAEAAAAAEVAKAEAAETASVVLLSPYTAHARQLLAHKAGVEVHTIDSFQGREADVVVLSLVRSGAALGFWQDPRRLTVALTRARRKLVLVASEGAGWPPESLLRRAVVAAAVA